MFRTSTRSGIKQGGDLIFSKNGDVQQNQNPFEILDGHAYYNASITNLTNVPIPAVYSQNLSKPIINVPSEYHFSIIRFTVPLTLVPIFIYNSLTTNKFTLSLTYAGSTYSTDVILPIGQPITNYQTVIDAFNVAYATDFTLLKIAHPAILSTQPPYLIYDNDNQFFSLVAQQTYQASQDNIGVYMNIVAYGLFYNFDSIHYGDNLPSKLDYQILIKNNLDNAYIYNQNQSQNVLSVTVPDAYIMTQLNPSLSLWTSTKSLRFVSGNIPTVNEFVTSVNTTQSQQTPILTDFELPINNNEQNNSYVQYSPTAEYRLLDLYGSTPLSKIDVNIYTVDFAGNVFPLMIPPEETITIKMLFRKKGSESIIQKY